MNTGFIHFYHKPFLRYDFKANALFCSAEKFSLTDGERGLRNGKVSKYHRKLLNTYSNI